MHFVLERVWPVAVVAFGFVLTASWIGLLAYEIVKLSLL